MFSRYINIFTFLFLHISMLTFVNFTKTNVRLRLMGTFWPHDGRRQIFMCWQWHGWLARLGKHPIKWYLLRCNHTQCYWHESYKHYVSFLANSLEPHGRVLFHVLPESYCSWKTLYFDRKKAWKYKLMLFSFSLASDHSISGLMPCGGVHNQEWKDSTEADNGHLIISKLQYS